MRASPGTADDVPPFSPASGTEAFPLPATGAAVVPPPRRRMGELLPSAGVASGTGATGAAAAKGAAAGTGSGKEAAGTVSVPRAAVRADDASLSGGAGKSSQSSSPGSTTRPPPDDDRPYSAARRSASAASAAASMGRSAGCRSGTGAVVGPASPADAGVVATAFLRPRPPDAAGCPARETALRPAADWGSPASGTAASASAACRTAKDPSTGGAICATASATGTGPSSATGAAFGLPARRRLGELFAAAGVTSGAGAAGAAAAKGAADGTDSGKEAAGTVSVPRAAVWADDASLSGGAGKSSQSSSPGSTTRPPPDDDRPYSAARRSASAASAAASMGRSAGCCSGTGAVVGPASPADAGVVAAAFLRPRPPEVGARPARETALRRAPE